MKQGVLILFVLVWAGVGLQVFALTLFSDSFDRPDSPDVNNDAAGCQWGMVAPLVYSSVSNGARASTSVTNSRVSLNVEEDGGTTRLIPQFNFGDPLLLEGPLGQFDVSYTVDAGVNYTGTDHGSYSSRLILTQAGMASNVNTGSANEWYGLYVIVAGDGQVSVYSRGIELFSTVNADYENAYVIGGENSIRVSVAMDSVDEEVLSTFTLTINGLTVGSSDFYWKRSDDLYVALEAVEVSSEFDNLRIDVPGDPVSLGVWEPFWRAQPVIGEWMAGGQGLATIQDYQKRNSFCVQTRASADEIPFADHLNAVRLIGGWAEGFGAEKPVPADAADLVYKDENGELQYRRDRLALRLDPYISRGYTNLTLVLDNMPYGLTTNPVMQSYGQVHRPDDFAEWHTFVSNMCVALVDLYGFETANNFRFRQGTEAQNIERFDGTQEEYFKIYDHSAAAVKGVLPGAKFGPFNAAGGIAEYHNVHIEELARHCASGTNYATGEIGSPFDFIGISYYLAQASRALVAPSKLVNNLATFDGVQAELPEPIPFEVHEFGILTCEDGLKTDEPGARGAAWRFHNMIGLRAKGLRRWYHWGVFDNFSLPIVGDVPLLKSNGWLLSILDRTVGGDACLLNASPTEESGTELKTIGVFGGERDWIMTSAYNPERLIHSTENVSIYVPTNLLQLAEGDTVLWTSLCQTNAAHWLIRQDLEELGLLNANFAAVPEQLAVVDKMISSDISSVDPTYVAERVEAYKQAVVDSLTLKPFEGTVRTNDGHLVFTLPLTPPETAVICIGSDRTEDGIPYEWLDRYGLATNGYTAAAAGDVDGDQLTAAQEYIIQSCPTNGFSVFHINASVSGGQLVFQTLESRLYDVYGTESLVEPDWQLISNAVPGTGGTVSVPDVDDEISERFYRFEVQLP